MDKCRINIAVIEPSVMIYEGLSNLLLKADNHYYLFRFNSLEELDNLSEKKIFHTAIINPALVQNKINEFQKLRKELPEVSWIALIYTFFDDELLKLFRNKISVTDQPEKITHLLNETCIPSSSSKNKRAQLTKREKDVLIQLTKGLSIKEISALLNISTHTVISHRKNITEKTGIKSISGLTIYAISQKIIPVDPS